MKMISTENIRLLIDDGWKKDRNRQANEWLRENLDPDGWHIEVFTMPHNDVEWRTQFMCKVIGTDEPASVWLDYDFDLRRLLVPVPEKAVAAE